MSFPIASPGNSAATLPASQFSVGRMAAPGLTPDAQPAAFAAKPTLPSHRPNPVLLGLLLFLALSSAMVLGIASFFWLDSPTRALRDGVMQSIPGQWDKRIAVNAGGVTFGLVRLGSGFFPVPREVRAVLQTVHGAQVGVYHLRRPGSEPDYSQAFQTADAAMAERGWARFVGVMQEKQLVAIYVPRRFDSPSDASFCIAVLNEDDLVIVNARGNLRPLLDIARERLPGRLMPLDTLLN